MFSELIKTRRSIRKFTEANIEQEHIALLKEALLRAPTGRNTQNWRFVFVTDPGKIAKMAEARPSGSAFLQGAPLVVVVAADPQGSDVWIENTSIAATFLQLQAHELGLASCWVQVRQRMYSDDITTETYLKDLLALPEEWCVLCMVGIGHPAEERPPREITDELRSVISEQ